MNTVVTFESGRIVRRVLSDADAAAFLGKPLDGDEAMGQLIQRNDPCLTHRLVALRYNRDEVEAFHRELSLSFTRPPGSAEVRVSNSESPKAPVSPARDGTRDGHHPGGT